MIDDAPPRWTVHPATEEDDEELLALFKEIFGHEMPLAQWRWKYADAPVRGVLLRRRAAAVAFFGGMPRLVHGPDRAWHAVQNGDVMVHPSERGVFSRQGALQHVAAAFFSQLVGPGRTHEFAFGFPSERHFRLGLKLDLYAAAGRMMSLGWASEGPSRKRGISVARLAGGNLRSLSQLWSAMTGDWPEHYIPVRDAQRWASRFLSHPAHQYEVFLAKGRWLGRACCALVLREHASHIEWLDYIGPRGHIETALAVAREFAGKAGGKPITALVSEDVASAFNAQAANCTLSDIHIPVNARPDGERRPYIGRLWLMGGDTDFL